MAAEIDRAVAQPSVLIVEYDVLISFGLALALNVAGCRVLGPTGSVRRALDIATAEHPEMALEQRAEIARKGAASRWER